MIEEEEAKEEGKGEGGDSTSPSDRKVPKVNSDSKKGDPNEDSINNSVVKKMRWNRSVLLLFQISKKNKHITINKTLIKTHI